MNPSSKMQYVALTAICIYACSKSLNQCTIRFKTTPRLQRLARRQSMQALQHPKPQNFAPPLRRSLMRAQDWIVDFGQVQSDQQTLASSILCASLCARACQCGPQKKCQAHHSNSTRTRTLITYVPNMRILRIPRPCAHTIH
jgi:hypothetical protein